MNRSLIVAVVAVGVVALAYLLFGGAPQRAVAPEQAPAPLALGTNAPTGAPLRSAPPHPASAPAGEPDTVTPVTADAGAPEPQGPFTIDFGQHILSFKVDPESRVIRTGLRVVVSNAAAQREVRLRRQELLRMVYFLGANRNPEGAIGEAGRDRFANDLLERFRNVIRSGAVESVELEGWAVGPRPDTSGRVPGPR